MCLCIAGRPTSPRRRLGAPVVPGSSDERVLHKQHTQHTQHAKHSVRLGWLGPASRAASILASHHLDAKKPSLSAATTSLERRTAFCIAALLICSSWLRWVVGF